jgi:2-polyprenyl-3-methyl-5-hydroxy-6-metoxy-1,4-benzoquinol methylase
MPQKDDFDSQYRTSRTEFLEKLDFLNWYRYFCLIQDVIQLKPQRVLEIGAGAGIVKSCLQSIVAHYEVLDINASLTPDFVADIRELQPQLKDRYDCIVVADVVEHVPFSDLAVCLANMREYLAGRGRILITIPHRRSHFLFMTPTYHPHVVTVPTGFLSPGAFYRRFIKRKIWIDPHHCWEIGDGKTRRADVERVFDQAGFQREKVRKLLYVDYWILRKE